MVWEADKRECIVRRSPHAHAVHAVLPSAHSPCPFPLPQPAAGGPHPSCGDPPPGAAAAGIPGLLGVEQWPDFIVCSSECPSLWRHASRFVLPRSMPLFHVVAPTGGGGGGGARRAAGREGASAGGAAGKEGGTLCCRLPWVLRHAFASLLHAPAHMQALTPSCLCPCCRSRCSRWPPAPRRALPAAPPRRWSGHRRPPRGTCRRGRRPPASGCTPTS